MLLPSLSKYIKLMFQYVQPIESFFMLDPQQVSFMY